MLRQLLDGGNYLKEETICGNTVLQNIVRMLKYFYAEIFGIDLTIHKNIFLLLGTKWSDRPENQR